MRALTGARRHATRWRHLADRARPRWPALQALLDASCWAAAVAVGSLIRYDFEFAAIRSRWPAVGAFAVVAAATFVVTAAALGSYRRRWRYGSFDELAALSLAAALTTAVVVAADVTFTLRPIPLGAALAAGPLALLGLCGLRYVGRTLDERLRRPSGAHTAPVLVYGAGNAGTQLIRSLVRNPDGRHLPVGLLDDDPAKKHLRISGVRVLGGRDDLARAARETGATLLVLAMPSVDGATTRTIVEKASEAGLAVQTLTSVKELLTGGASARNRPPQTANSCDPGNARAYAPPAYTTAKVGAPPRPRHMQPLLKPTSNRSTGQIIYHDPGVPAETLSRDRRKAGPLRWRRECEHSMRTCGRRKLQCSPKPLPLQPLAAGSDTFVLGQTDHQSSRGPARPRKNPVPPRRDPRTSSRREASA